MPTYRRVSQRELYRFCNLDPNDEQDQATLEEMKVGVHVGTKIYHANVMDAIE